jgi:hypothetical protein
MDAGEVARRLGRLFLERGQYAFASGAITGHEATPAATREAFVPSIEEQGFAGLAVQSVGYELGAPEPKVHIYVTKGSKRMERELTQADGNIKVEVKRIGRVLVRPEMASAASLGGNVYLRGTRVACGSSCAPAAEMYAGTLGALVRKGKGKKVYILSNNHVLGACNHVPVGMPIMTPSNIDARPQAPAPSAVGRHSEIEELRSGDPFLVQPLHHDVALALADDDRVSSWQGDPVDGYDTPSTIAPLRSGLRVKKFGRTTGLTLGTVEAFVNSPTPLPYRTKFFTATVYFENVWTVRADGEAFALPGDSGSLVVTDDAQAAVGLVFAASPNGEYGFVIPMDHVKTLLGGIQLVSKYGL